MSVSILEQQISDEVHTAYGPNPDPIWPFATPAVVDAGSVVGEVEVVLARSTAFDRAGLEGPIPDSEPVAMRAS